jgi:hypothetical protein
VVPQSGTKDQFFGTVYYTTLNSWCETHLIAKNLSKIGFKPKLMDG